ncbi:hypothetical protein VTN77DRAFT_7575 [Rasamsonia byssochlamydoides]|uniref:uncharacterized protein n=1 Tax=Rasamsonia byssochlamydoides TaxID=89139 RepID=UPI003743315E
MNSPHPQRHRLSPSFADSAIDVDLTDTSASKESVSHNHAIPLPDRLSRIAAQASLRSLGEQECAAVHQYLDAIETLLDPRPGLSREIARNRPSSSRSGTATPAVSPTTRTRRSSDDVPSDQKALVTAHRQLTVLLKDLSDANAQLQQRRMEARHIHDLFTSKCEGLAQRVIELEEEVHELQSDILEDSIELEGLRGTVRGLESWIGRWQRQRELSGTQSTAALPRPRKSKWRRKRQSEDTNHEEENDCDVLLEGICAWMRGWKDIEEGFRIRARRRKLRRERRKSYGEEIPSN